MIEYIRGILAEKTIGFVAVEAHGVGYAVSIPLSTYEALPAPGVEVKLLIHYLVREDAHKLYGFFTDDERLLFRQLLGISKIGPKVALNVLSGMPVADVVASVNNGDSSRMRKIPGVGAKTAERLVMELKGKLGMVSGAAASLPSQGDGAPVPSAHKPQDEVIAAMLSLGYNEKQVTKALERVAETGTGSDEPVEVWIRKALQVI